METGLQSAPRPSALPGHRQPSLFPEGDFAGGRGAAGARRGRGRQAAPELGPEPPVLSPARGRSSRNAGRREAAAAGPSGAAQPLQGGAGGWPRPGGQRQGGRRLIRPALTPARRPAGVSRPRSLRELQPGLRAACRVRGQSVLVPVPLSTPGVTPQINSQRDLGGRCPWGAARRADSAGGRPAEGERARGRGEERCGSRSLHGKRFFSTVFSMAFSHFLALGDGVPLPGGAYVCVPVCVSLCVCVGGVGLKGMRCRKAAFESEDTFSSSIFP